MDPTSWTVPEGAELAAAEVGGMSRERAYEARLTAEGLAAFADRGYLATGHGEADLARNREQVASDLARNLPADAAARMWQAAYAGVPGIAEYRARSRDADGMQHEREAGG
jgi:hypothetical protein